MAVTDRLLPGEAVVTMALAIIDPARRSLFLKTVAVAGDMGFRPGLTLSWGCQIKYRILS